MDNISNIKKKNNLVLCNLYIPQYHGYTNDSDPNIIGQFLVIEKISYSQNSLINAINYSKEMSKYMEYYLYNMIFMDDKNMLSTPIVKIYNSVEIGECFYLSGNECVCVLKTFWLKIIQRKWKKVFALRKKIILKRKNPNTLKQFEISGTWNSVLPSLKGMLCY